MFAVNVGDWYTFKDCLPVQILLQPVVDINQAPVECERKRIDGLGMVFTCSEERSQAIVEVIRLKIPKHRLRIYKRIKSRWQRV